jgi:hypothetical protein
MPKKEKDKLDKVKEVMKADKNIEYTYQSGKKKQKNILVDINKLIDYHNNGGKTITTKTHNRPKEEEVIILEPPPQQIPAPAPVAVVPAKKGGRPKKYATVEEAKSAKREQTLKSNKKKYDEKKQAKVQGEGIKDIFTNLMDKGSNFVEKTVNKGANFVEKTGNKIKEFGKAVIYGRNDYQPKGRNILKKYGEEHIIEIEIGRDPVVPALKGVLNVISGGQFGKNVEKANYDELFHLFMVLTLESGKKIMIEKNEVIVISEAIPARSEKAQYRKVPPPPFHNHINLKTLMDNAQKRMGNKFFTYSAKDNNCQDFLVNVLQASNIGSPDDFSFIKQDTKQLFKDLPFLRKFSNSVTDFASKLDVIVSGQGLKPDYKIQSVIFEKDKWDIKTAKKWLRDNDYDAPKVDEKENYIRFRQISPDTLENQGLDNYRTKSLGKSGIKLIIGYKKKSNPNIYKMEGGKIKSKDVEKFFRNIGKKVIGKKATKEVEKFGNKAGDYITAKKGGLATDLIDYGVPAATAAILGGIGGLATGGLGGVAGSAMGSKLGKEVIAKELHKATGAGVKGGNKWIMFVKAYASKNGMKYNEALKDPKLKMAYQKSKN